MRKVKLAPPPPVKMIKATPTAGRISFSATLEAVAPPRGVVAMATAGARTRSKPVPTKKTVCKVRAIVYLTVSVWLCPGLGAMQMRIFFFGGGGGLHLSFHLKVKREQKS